MLYFGLRVVFLFVSPSLHLTPELEDENCFSLIQTSRLAPLHVWLLCTDLHCFHFLGGIFLCLQDSAEPFLWPMWLI